MMSIKEQMHDVEVISKDRKLKDISFIIDNDTPDALLIIENAKIEGIVTDTDLLVKAGREKIYSEEISVKDVMSSPVITIDIEKSIKEAISLMVEHNINKLPVIENGLPAGVLYGEDILELDEESWKKIIFKQTIEEVFKILLREPDIESVSVLNIISDTDKFSDMDSKVDFDLFIYQQGIVLVAYNYIKENKDKNLEEITDYIRLNYEKLLQQYSSDEEF